MDEIEQLMAGERPAFTHALLAPPARDADPLTPPTDVAY